MLQYARSRATGKSGTPDRQDVRDLGLEIPTGRDVRGTLRALVHAPGLERGRRGKEERIVDSASARRCIRLFVAARLPAPTGVGPAARRTPPRNAEAFRYKMRRRCMRGFRLCAAMHSPFRSGAASRADGSGARSPPDPRSERGGVPLQNACLARSSLPTSDIYPHCSSCFLLCAFARRPHSTGCRMPNAACSCSSAPPPRSQPGRIDNQPKILLRIRVGLCHKGVCACPPS